MMTIAMGGSLPLLRPPRPRPRSNSLQIPEPKLFDSALLQRPAEAPLPEAAQNMLVPGQFERAEINSDRLPFCGACDRFWV